MDFVTLPQLARDLNIPERRVRHRFRRLVAAGKLVEGKDFNKEEFQDEFHFTYMIHPQHFIQEAKFQKEARTLFETVPIFSRLVPTLATIRSRLITKWEPRCNHLAAMLITNSSHLLAIWVPNKMRMTLPWSPG